MSGATLQDCMYWQGKCKDNATLFADCVKPLASELAIDKLPQGLACDNKVGRVSQTLRLHFPTHCSPKANLWRAFPELPVIDQIDVSLFFKESSMANGALASYSQKEWAAAHISRCAAVMQAV